MAAPFTITHTTGTRDRYWITGPKGTTEIVKTADGSAADRASGAAKMLGQQMVTCAEAELVRGRGVIASVSSSA